MSKLVVIFFAAVALIQIIKPLGLPGLRYRRDAWKLAVAGFMVIVVLASLRSEEDTSAPERQLQEAPAPETPAS